MRENTAVSNLAAVGGRGMFAPSCSTEFVNRKTIEIIDAIGNPTLKTIVIIDAIGNLTLP